MKPQAQITVGEFLASTIALLSRAGIATGRLDALVLLEDVLGRDRAQLLAHLEIVLTHTQQVALARFIQRRAEHEPLAYIRQKTEFYGRVFYVNHRVLEPRPESETMIDILQHIATNTAPTVVDVGTGSGALAITAKLELPGSEVIAIDIDENCLAVAARNADRLHAPIKLIKSDLLDAVPAKVLKHAILLCNLPYVPDSFQINPAAMREPRLAIFGGPDGLNLYRQLFAYIKSANNKPAYVLTEAMPPQHDELNSIALGAGFVLARSQDFIQCFKMATDNSAS
jgi:release factor glutamine methyltransferase